MIDLRRRTGVCEARNRRQRHHRRRRRVHGRARGRVARRQRRRTRACPAVRRHVDVFERLRRLRVLRIDLHYHVILVQARIDRRYLPLAERVVQRVVDVAGADAEARCGIAVDRDVRLERPLLLVGVDVREARVLLETLGEPRRPLAQVREVVALERVLVRRVRRRPPIRRSCTGFRKTATPVICASLAAGA